MIIKKMASYSSYVETIDTSNYGQDIIDAYQMFEVTEDKYEIQFTSDDKLLVQVGIFEGAASVMMTYEGVVICNHICSFEENTREMAERLIEYFDEFYEQSKAKHRPDTDAFIYTYVNEEAEVEQIVKDLSFMTIAFIWNALYKAYVKSQLPLN